MDASIKEKVTSPAPPSIKHQLTLGIVVVTSMEKGVVGSTGKEIIHCSS